MSYLRTADSRNGTKSVNEIPGDDPDLSSESLIRIELDQWPQRGHMIIEITVIIDIRPRRCRILITGFRPFQPIGLEIIRT